jgi:hypothetical protein
MPRRRTGRRRGRRYDPKAKRHRTTRIGRRTGFDPIDQGSTLLRAKKRAATSREDVELTPAGILFGHGYLDAQQYDVLSTVTLWLQRLARGWAGLGGVTGLWYSILGAAVPIGFVQPQNPIASGLADSARRQLHQALRRLDGSRSLVVALAEGALPDVVVRVLEGRLTPADVATLERLRQGLDRVAGRWS